VGVWNVVQDIAGPVAACAVLVGLIRGAIIRRRVQRALARDPELRKEAEILAARAFSQEDSDGVVDGTRRISTLPGNPNVSKGSLL
jgi:hypothetical protein